MVKIRLGILREERFTEGKKVKINATVQHRVDLFQEAENIGKERRRDGPKR